MTGYGVLHTVLEMIETGATHLGVATDHVIESFRNHLWPGYKTSAGVERALLAQCVRGDRVVQVDRRGNKILTADGVRAKFGVDPLLIPDFLALVGDAADGYPGISGIGPSTAAQLLNRYGALESFPPEVLRDRDLALRFKDLATLRTDAPLFQSAGELQWRGPTAAFSELAERLGDARLLSRCLRAAGFEA